MVVRQDNVFTSGMARISHRVEQTDLLEVAVHLSIKLLGSLFLLRAVTPSTTTTATVSSTTASAPTALLSGGKVLAPRGALLTAGCVVIVVALASHASSAGNGPGQDHLVSAGSTVVDEFTIPHLKCWGVVNRVSIGGQDTDSKKKETA